VPPIFLPPAFIRLPMVIKPGLKKEIEGNKKEVYFLRKPLLTYNFVV
jgi:hypothetical protein